MLRAAALFACLSLLAGAAGADVAPDYPETLNRYRFELAAAEGFDAEGAQLVLVTKVISRGDDEAKARYTIQRIGEDAIGVERWHWSHEHHSKTLLLVRGELPAKLDKAWLDGATPLAKLDLSEQLPSQERAKDDNEDYEQQVYTVVVTPKLTGDALALSAKKTAVSRMDKDGKVLSTEALGGKETGSVLPDARSRGVLGLGALLGLLGLGGLTLTRRKTDRAAA
ncbi:MAG: hypothetical protein KDD82_03860 [Planctomycetes bacterium]|nr:hypothetical protein [Planctomycetota bacterium]